jgi:hypothetical protein
MVGQERVCGEWSKRVLGLSAILLMTACSTMETTRPPTVSSATLKDQTYQVRVRSGNEVMDQILFEQAVLQVGKLLNVAETATDASGYIDITFASSSQSTFVGTSSGYATTSGYANGWYTGNTASVSAGAVTRSTSVSAVTSFTWQNSTMIFVLKDHSGKRLWSADYEYKGGWELSGFSVNTPQEAAKLCIHRITAKLATDLKH